MSPSFLCTVSLYFFITLHGRVVSAETRTTPVRECSPLLSQKHRLHSTHSLFLSFSDTSFRFRFALCHLSLSVSYLLSLLLFHTFIELGFTVPLSLRLPPSRSLFSCLSLSLLNKLPLMIVVKQTFLNNAWHLYRLVTFSLCAFEAQRIHFWRKTRKALCK